MNLYSQINEVCALLKVVSPTMTTDFVIKKLQPIYEENKHLSDAAIIRKLIEHIQLEHPFGKEIAEAAEELKKEHSYSTEEVFNTMDFSGIVETAKSIFSKHEERTTDEHTYSKKDEK